MGFEPGVSGNPRGRPRGSRNKATRAVAEWTAAILADEQVQARLLSDARQGRLHHAVLGQLLLYAYGRPAVGRVHSGDLRLHDRGLEYEVGEYGPQRGTRAAHRGTNPLSRTSW